jgi:hypothetical protein
MEENSGGCAKTGLAVNATIGYHVNETAGISYNPNPLSSGPVEMVAVNRKFRLASVNALAGIGLDF